MDACRTASPGQDAAVAVLNIGPMDDRMEPRSPRNCTMASGMIGAIFWRGRSTWFVEPKLRTANVDRLVQHTQNLPQKFNSRGRTDGSNPGIAGTGFNAPDRRKFHRGQISHFL
jgi:hypothetical protein